MHGLWMASILPWLAALFQRMLFYSQTCADFRFPGKEEKEPAGVVWPGSNNALNRIIEVEVALACGFGSRLPV
jgi:hypothetical protein